MPIIRKTHVAVFFFLPSFPYVCDYYLLCRTIHMRDSQEVQLIQRSLGAGFSHHINLFLPLSSLWELKFNSQYAHLLFCCCFQMWYLRTWRGSYWCSHALGLLFLFVHSSSCLPLISFWFFYDLNMSLTWGFKVRSVDFRNSSLQIYGVVIVRDSVHETNCLPTKAIKIYLFYLLMLQLLHDICSLKKYWAWVGEIHLDLAFKKPRIWNTFVLWIFGLKPIVSCQSFLPEWNFLVSYSWVYVIGG